MLNQPKILIIGAGPTGLGAAWRLHELDYDNWDLFEAESYCGGLASSFIDHKGFIWDLGVHVYHSHYPYFNQVQDTVMANEWLEHKREAWIWLRDRLIPYPLQHHISWLPKADRRMCQDALEKANQIGCDKSPDNFAQWVLQQHGDGLAKLFMFPYNRKVWACEPEDLGIQWIGERVAPRDQKAISPDVVGEQDRSSWGPNAMFRYPRHGGSGAMWNCLFAQLPNQNKHLNMRAISIQPDIRNIEFEDKSNAMYDVLISTMPLDRLITIMKVNPALKAAAGCLRYSSLHVIGIGLDGKPPDCMNAKSWIYFPQPDVPFHRVTVFSNYAPNNVPQPDTQWSLIAEASQSLDIQTDISRMTEDTIAGLHKVRCIPQDARIVDTYHRRLEHAYPTPLANRDKVLQEILPALEELDIFSRGRFGAWKYEAGNMDHSFMQGIEAVNHILFGTNETTLQLS